MLVTLLLASTVFLTGCFGDGESNSSTISNTHASAITPIGVPATCLTVHSPLLVKLNDGFYQLVDVIDNCGGKIAGPLQITAQIDAGKTKQGIDLVGPTTISANGKAKYSTSSVHTSKPNKEIHFFASTSPSAFITVLVTIKGSMQGEWDGQVTIPGI